MKNPQTLTAVLTAVLLSVLSACEKLEVPTNEKSPDTKEVQGDTTHDGEDETPEEKGEDVDTTAWTSTDSLIYYVETHGTDEAFPYSVRDFKTALPTYLALHGASGISGAYVCGYVVGHIQTNGRRLSQTVFAAGDVETNIVMADHADERDYDNCIAVQLSTGSKNQKEVREGLNIATHPENLGKFVILCGNIETYMGTLGLKSVRDCIIVEE